jgi:hypothetical protein
MVTWPNKFNFSIILIKFCVRIHVRIRINCWTGKYFNSFISYLKKYEIFLFWSRLNMTCNVRMKLFDLVTKLSGLNRCTRGRKSKSHDKQTRTMTRKRIFWKTELEIRKNIKKKNSGYTKPKQVFIALYHCIYLLCKSVELYSIPYNSNHFLLYYLYCLRDFLCDNVTAVSMQFSYNLFRNFHVFVFCFGILVTKHHHNNNKTNIHRS